MNVIVNKKLKGKSGNMENQKEETKNTENTFIVECFVNGKWIVLFDNVTIEKANQIADFMRLGEPAPNSVRVRDLISS